MFTNYKDQTSSTNTIFKKLNNIYRNVLGENNIKRICIATASVAKFGEAVKAAGLPCQPDNRVTALEMKATRYEEMEQGQDWEQILRDKIISINE